MEKNAYLKTPDFYKDYKETNAALVLGLIIISLGFYTINWIYLRNKEFELMENIDAPDSKRGAVILMVLPFTWFFTYMVIKNLFFINTESIFLTILKPIGWSIIFVLIIKYIYDFCESFGKITRTSGSAWFVFFLIGLIGIFSTIHNFIYLSPLIFFIMIIIPTMQSELNSQFTRLAMKKKGNIFYS